MHETHHEMQQLVSNTEVQDVHISISEKTDLEQEHEFCYFKTQKKKKDYTSVHLSIQSHTSNDNCKYPKI